MSMMLEEIGKAVADAFEAVGYDAALGTVTVSNRPDLCEYQCNGAMAGAKRYGKAPLVIAEEVAGHLADCEVFQSAEAVKPGFLNLTLSPAFLCKQMEAMQKDKALGVPRPAHAEKVVLDYGGPNIAKPLHVGHLRSAIIGESLKRILRFNGYDVIGDIHMGDWGLPIGLVITELRHRHPDWAFFEEGRTEEFPKEALFTVAELEEVYPVASAKSKTDEAYRAEAMEATRLLQDGDPGHRALWRQIMEVSKADLKRNYDRLRVSFDLWRGEADVHERIAPMVDRMRRTGIAHESDGALVIDVAREDDTREIPPCIILKSDGAALYATTDLATIEQRMEEMKPSKIIYLTDKRQEMHFIQVFRAARTARLVLPETELTHIGFGTMNGKDGKPYKTRDGGVPRLEGLIDEIEEQMYERVREGGAEGISEDEARDTASKIALSAIKYGDLSNQPSKDYIFDLEKFTSFEGDTGPYILYTIVRVKSILQKYAAQGGDIRACALHAPANPTERALQLQLLRLPEAIVQACASLSPNRLCAGIYALCNALNSFYHETRILTEEDPQVKEGYLATLSLTLRALETSIDLLGFDAPERM